MVRRMAAAAADRDRRARHARMRFGREGEGRRRNVLLLLGGGRNRRRCRGQVQRSVRRRRDVAGQAEVLRVGQIQTAHVVAGTHGRRWQTVAVRGGQTGRNAARMSPEAGRRRV